jgi:uncharacterized protein (TIGR02466 family)
MYNGAFVQDIFPVKIYCEFTKNTDPINYQKLQKSCGQMLETFDIGNIGKPDNWPENVSTSFRNENVNNLFDGHKEVEYIITEKCKRYLADAFDVHSKIKIVDSWVNLYEETQYQFTHNHLATPDDKTLISGSYYYNTNGCDGNIVFVNEHQHDLSTSGHTQRPEEGLLLLFPSWLGHYVQANTTNNKRISFSFNFIKDNTHGY